MAVQRLSKLQKTILLTLREAPERSMARSVLLFKIFRWQKHNLYQDNHYMARLDGRKFWAFKDGKGFLDSKGAPPGYKSKQASFTRSLKLLAKHGFIELLTRINFPIDEQKDFDREKSLAKGLERYRQHYQKEKESGKTKAKSFDIWFEASRPHVIFGYQTGGYIRYKSIWRSNYGRRHGRNATKLKLTDKGYNKTTDLLKVKYGTPSTTFNINEHIELEKGDDL